MSPYEMGPFEWPLRYNNPRGNVKPSPKPKPPTNPMPPIYVIVYTHCIWAGQGPIVSSTLALTAAAIKAGCSIDKQFDVNNNGFGEYIGEWVIKVPKDVGGNLFSLTLAGTSYIKNNDPDPTQFCGHFVGTASLVLIGPALDVKGKAIPGIGQWAFSWSITDPTGVHADTATVLGGMNPKSPPFSITPYKFNYSMICYYDPSSGDLINTGVACGSSLPTFGTLPFEVAVYVNPVEGHTLHDPGWPYDPTDIVRTSESTGDRTQVWGWSVNHHALAGTTPFAMGYRPLTTKNKDSIHEKWPSGTIVGARTYDAFGPFMRKIVPLPSHTLPASQRVFPWNGDIEIPLRCGSPPALISVFPFT